jgi:glycosyltransferase involved in cell wall biosynthesis
VGAHSPKTLVRPPAANNSRTIVAAWPPTTVLGLLRQFRARRTYPRTIPRTMNPQPDPQSHLPNSDRPAAVIVATTFPARPGDGTPEFVLTLARSIRDFDVTVVVPRVPGAAREEVIDGVRVRRAAYFPARWERLAADAIMPTLRAEPWRLIEVPFLVGALFLTAWREVRRQRAVVVNPHWIVPAGLVAFALRLVTRVPYVVTVHGADAYTLRGRMAGRLKRLVLGRAAAVLPVSGDIARTLSLDPRAPVLRMGVDTGAIRSIVVLCIGRLADKKGVDVLVEAVARVPGIRAEIIGDGPDRQALEDRARRLGVADRVRFLGRQPKTSVLQALGRAEVVAIPSKVGAGGDMEGTPVVLCEAMAAGAPVVASDLGGLGECIVDGKTGLLVQPGDVDALAAALRKVASGAVDLDALGTAAADEAARSLDIGEVGRAYDQVMADAAGLDR